VNGNLPHAAGVIRAVLESVRSDQATLAAHALDRARLLVDPERSFGTVLHRTPEGHWTRAPQPVTELEHQALAWTPPANGPARWRAPSSATSRTTRARTGSGWTATACGSCCGSATTPNGHTGRPADPGARGDSGREREGVPVTVVAHSPAPAPPPAKPPAPARPFRLGSITYDLALPLRDIHGDVWYFHGCRNRDGMPLLSIDGRPERCSLANVAEHLGPLSPVRPSTPVRLAAAAHGPGDTGTPPPVPIGPPPEPAESPAGTSR
jgi:hypothetical protein